MYKKRRGVLYDWARPYMKKICFLPFKIANELWKETSESRNSQFDVDREGRSKNVLKKKEVTYKGRSIYFGKIFMSLFSFNQFYRSHDFYFIRFDWDCKCYHNISTSDKRLSCRKILNTIEGTVIYLFTTRSLYFGVEQKLPKKDLCALKSTISCPAKNVGK